MDVVALLRELGFTEYEARALSALFRAGRATAGEISSLARIPKSRVYDVLSGLVRKGVILEVVGKPKLYVVKDPKGALRKIIYSKKRELDAIERKIEDVNISIGEASREVGERYIIFCKTIDDFIELLPKEFSVGYSADTPESIVRLPVKKIKTPFDIIISDDAVYLPACSVSFPERDVRVIVFKDSEVLNMFRRWYYEREDL